MMTKQKEDNEIIKKMRVELQISSNLRACIGLQGSEDPRYTVGIPKQLTYATEHHILTFERYTKLPFELKMKLQKELKNDPNRDKNAAETVNPWLITDIDYYVDSLQNSK